MLKLIKLESRILVHSAFVLSIISCGKELSSRNTTNSSNTTQSTSSTIAVATDSTGRDSVYIIQPVGNGYFRDSIGQSGLPDSALTYLTNNYSGYTFEKAFVIKDNAGTVGGYVAIISYNGKPIGLLFDANGNFTKVLEQREYGDLHGDGWHHGGRYSNRDGLHNDSISISSLPASILSYMTSHYPEDTIIKAYQNIDSSILVISKDNGLNATLFTAAGTFIKRIPLSPPVQVEQIVVEDSLPSKALSFLTTTFPNYVFENATSLTVNNIIQGYLVVLDADNTKYAVWFDAAGKMIAIQTIW